jgi:ATP-dependent helicase HepA
MLVEPYELPPPDDRSPIAADFLARWQARLFLAHRQSGLGGAEGVRSDLELAPHQARAVLEVLSAPRVRHVLADEVGMGKTIEALMVYEALRIQDPKLRTLVLVPGHLAFQWLGEIYLRAHRVFAIASEDRPEALELGSDVLLDREWLTAKRGAGARTRLLESVRAKGPCLLVVDEAHRLTPAGTELVRDLASAVDHVLLLTATPVELEAKSEGRGADQLRYEELLRLLDPDLSARDLDKLRETEGRVTERFLARPKDRAGEKVWFERLADAAGDDRARMLAARAGASGDDEDVEDLLDYVAARGLAAWRVIRHRRADAPKVFRKRLARMHSVKPLPGFLDVVSRVAKPELVWEASVSVERFAHAIEKDASLAQVHDALLSLAKEEDPKLVKLRELISGAWAEDRKAGKKSLRKFLVFVPDLETLERAEHFLEFELSTDVAVFHEGLDNTLREDGEPPERLQQLLAFRNQPSTAILICTDIAAEGHNLHSACHTVVLYDLPRNPNTTEQRIGRVDRLGQTRDVTVHVLLLEGTDGPAQAERQAALGVFERSLGALAPSEEEALAAGAASLGRERRDLTSPLRAFRNRPTEELGERVRSLLETPAGWVFRASSQFADWYSDPSLAQACLGSLLSRAAVRAFDLRAQKNESPPPGVRESLRFRLSRGDEPIPGYRDTWGTCDRDEALEQDHLQFFASGHPFVEDVLGRATTGDHGARQALRLRLPSRGPARGTLAHFVWDPGRSLVDRPAIARIARSVFPTLSIPVVVAAAEGKKLAVEVGPPSGAEASLRRDLLQALVELDPNVCESLLEDAVAPEEFVPWVAQAREAAVAHARERLAETPTRLGRRALARCAGEIERDATRGDRATVLELVERVLPELGTTRLEQGLFLDGLATFEIVDPRRRR